MIYVKLDKKLRFEPYYTEKPVLVLKKFNHGKISMYRLNINFASFFINVKEIHTFIDEECKNLIREKKLERLVDDEKI